MRREAPDPRFYSEIRDLNLEFLRLIRTARRGTCTLFGLDSSVVDQLVRLTVSQLESVAATPCLLAVVASGAEPATRRSVIAEPALDNELQWQEATRVFLASLLTYVWQTARRDPLLAGLCAGWPSEGSTQLREASFRDLHAFCDSRQHALRARFHVHPRFWPDLVSAARAGDAQRVHLARMSGIQLALNPRSSVVPNDSGQFSDGTLSRPGVGLR
jgi:hypothetical protein